MVSSGILYALALTVAIVDLTGLSGLSKAGLIVIGFAISTVVGYVQIYTPYVRRRNEYLKTVMDLASESLLGQYASAGKPADEIRVNLMLMRKKYRLFGKRQLHIAYEYGEYAPTERNLVYDIGVGNAGFALEKNEPRVFDREGSKGNLDLFRMTPAQEEATRSVGSILSTPVYSPDDEEKSHPIGILNLDSQLRLEESGFDEEHVLDMAMRLATVAGILYA